MTVTIGVVTGDVGMGVSLCGIVSIGRGAGNSGAEFITQSIPFAFCIKSRGSTLYFAMRS